MGKAEENVFCSEKHLELGALLRKRVARAAAQLLYEGVAKEYKQAKEMAAESTGAKFLPTNFEVAMELDEVSEELEGEERHRRLVRMRNIALDLMEYLSEFHPRLIGSVWRGTANYRSDIDIVVYAQNKQDVLEAVRSHGVQSIRHETETYTESRQLKTSDHIYLTVARGLDVEIIVRSPDEMEEYETCDIFGDAKRGLNLSQLKQVLEEDPFRRYVPSKRR